MRQAIGWLRRALSTPIGGHLASGSCRNLCSELSLTSRRCEGAPEERISSLPVNRFIHPAACPINTSWSKLLRRPIEPAQYLSIAYIKRHAIAGIEPSVGGRGGLVHLNDN